MHSNFAALPYDSTCPVIYDNDGTLESGGGVDTYIYALASAGIIQLKGVITTCSFGEWDRGFAPVSDEEAIRERKEFVEKARRSGMRYLPDVVAGPTNSFEYRRPSSGRIEDTKTFDSPGGRLIVQEALKATPEKPLVIVMGGQATAVADAYLLNPAIAGRVILSWICFTKGSGTVLDREYNFDNDPWASFIVCERLKAVVFPFLHDHSKNGWPSEKPRRYDEMPNTELRQMHLEYDWPRYSGYQPDVIGAIPLTRSDYVLRTKSFSFSGKWQTVAQGYMKGWSVKVPVYTEDPNGRVLACWELNGAAGTAEWWNRLLDPKAWGTSQGQVPWNGQPWPVGTAIEAEYFDHGGTHVSYFNNSNNFGTDYDEFQKLANSIRILEHVKIFASTAASGGFYVGKALAGEWMEYTIAVSSAGIHRMELKVASDGSGGTFHIEVDGQNRSGTVTVPNTGGWAEWQSIQADLGTLTTGTHVLRLKLDDNGATGTVGNFDLLRVIKDSPGIGRVAA